MYIDSRLVPAGSAAGIATANTFAGKRRQQGARFPAKMDSRRLEVLRGSSAAGLVAASIFADNSAGIGAPHACRKLRSASTT